MACPLAKAPFFASVPDRNLRRLAECLEIQHLLEGEYVFKQGEIANQMAIIVEGTVDIIRKSRDEGESDARMYPRRDHYRTGRLRSHLRPSSPPPLPSHLVLELHIPHPTPTHSPSSNPLPFPSSSLFPPLYLQKQDTSR